MEQPFSQLNNPLSEISNLSIGENILQWSIIGECGSHRSGSY